MLGAEPPTTLVLADNLAMALEARWELSEAARIFREALEVQQRVLGPEHRTLWRQLATWPACSRPKESSTSTTTAARHERLRQSQSAW